MRKLIFASFIFCIFGCSQQIHDPLRTKEARKHNKEVQKELQSNFKNP